MIITLTGHKNSGKDNIAYSLAKNDAVEYVYPYTDRPVPKKMESERINENYHFVDKDELDLMMNVEDVLCATIVNGHRYVFFEKQIQYPYNVLIVDDYTLANLKENWKGKLYTVRVKSKNEVESERVGEYFYEHEFDEVFNYDSDDIDELEARISYVY